MLVSITKLLTKSERIKMKRTKIVVLMVLIATVTLGTVWYNQSDSSVTVASENQSETDAKFEEIYVVLKNTGDYICQMGDMNVRNLHYAKPHQSLKWLCPECADLWGKKKESIVEVPVDRLKKLRAIRREALSLPTPSDQPNNDEPVKTPTTVEELDSILLLLKQQQSHLHTNKHTMDTQYHYLKKHTHKYDNCPDCIKLRTKQAQETEFVSKKEYDELIKLEKEYSDAPDKT
jgi:hypothetical protein